MTAADPFAPPTPAEQAKTGYVTVQVPAPAAWGSLSWDTYLRAKWPKDNPTITAILEMLVARPGEWAKYTRDQLGTTLFRALGRATRETFPFQSWTQPMVRDEIHVRCDKENLVRYQEYFRIHLASPEETTP